MTNVMMWSLILGFLSSHFIIPLIQQPRWSTSTRSLVTFVFSIVIGFVNAWLNSQLNFADILTSILTLLVTSIAVYEGLAKQIGIAPAIERATEVNRE